MMNFGRAAMRPIWSVTDFIGLTRQAKPQLPPEKAVPQDQLRCLGYGMLANLEGASVQREVDKERIICTLKKRAEFEGTDVCFVFRRQRELVTPSWGVRKYSKLGITIKVPDRSVGYIERTFDETARNAALLLAKQTRCEGWNGIAIKRPDRKYTIGNQKPDELADIDAKMVPVVPPTQGDTFVYLKMK